jgi:hypothetical protein
LVLEILPSVAATVIGGYLLAQLHFGHGAESSAQSPSVAASSAEPTVGQDRAAMNQVLKDRREVPEKPALVRVPVRIAATPTTASVPVAAPARPASTAIPVGLHSISPREPAARPVAPSRPTVTAQTAAPAVAPAPQVEETEIYVPAPPPGLPAAPPRGMDAPTVLVPSGASAPAPATPVPNAPSAAQLPSSAQLAPPATAANTPPAAPAEPAHRGPVGAVFSTFSSFVGHATNATGHTVNWVIDLPGKAISAGGRVIGVTPEPAESPPPPARPFS